MKNRKWILVVSLVVSLAMSLSGTLAYLTATDSDVNVMTLGNVKIDQLENGMSEGGFETQPLYPAYYTDGETDLAQITGALKKEVTVKNTGDSEAYVRTWIALEAGNLTLDNFNSIIHAQFGGEGYKLSDAKIIAIEDVNYYVVCATYTNALAAGETTKPSLKSVYMDKKAGNADVAQFDSTYEILVYTQAMQTANMDGLTAEEALIEGFGTDHPWVNGVDILPTATVSTADELRTALAAGGTTVVLANDIELDADETLTIADGVTARLDLAGHTLSGESDATGSNRNMIDVRGTLTVNNGKMEFVHTGDNMGWGNSTNIFNVTDGGVLNLNGVTAENKGGSDMAFVVHLNNWGEVTLNVNDSYLGSTYVPVRVFNSGNDMNNVSIYNSTLLGDDYSFWVHNYTPADFSGSEEKAETQKKLLNLDIQNGTNTLVGAIRYGFTNKVVDEESSEPNSAYVTNDEALDAAIGEGNTKVYLSSGNYIVPSSAKGKTLTFVGNGDTSVAVTKVGTGGENCDYGLDGSTATFENITITTNSSTYIGYARMKGTYKNCTINGTYTLYDNSVFENCTFNVSGDVYNVWTWGAPKATFTNCTFNSDGKAMLLYGTADTKLTVENCTFNDNGGLTDLKAAIEIGNDYGKSYELTVNNTKVNGYEINDKGINTGTTLWANKNSMGTDKLNVVVDGEDVY